MAQTREGAAKTAAAHAGISLAEYLALRAAGLKRCRACREWRKAAAFVRDLSRSDGLASRCRTCSSSRTSPGPSLIERRARSADGLSWCRRCGAWTSERTRGGLCRAHIREQDRARYKADPEFRQRRQAKTMRRRRGVEGVPLIGQEVLLEDFGGLCAYCRKAKADTWDHIVPVTAGGQTTADNIVPACRSCNSSKRSRSLDEWIAATGMALDASVIERQTLADCAFGE